MTLHELTMEIAGNKEGRLVLLGARPTMGKTSVAMGMALDLASQGKIVNYVSCSEKESFMIQHMEFINKGPLSEIQNQNINAPEPAAFSVADIAAFCENQPDAVFVDTIQELNKEQGSFNDLQKALKELADKLNCPVIVLSQLTDSIDKGLFHKPKVSDLAKTDLDASLFDEVMLFYRKSRYKANAPKTDCLIVFKNREEKFVWSDVTNCIM